MPAQNRLDPMGSGARLSTNLTIDRQTPKTDFGDLVQNGLAGAVGSAANGLSLAAPLVPGGAILSAAVSSLGTMAQPAVTARYAATGLTTLGGPNSINTTVPGAAATVGTPALPPGAGTPSALPGVGSDPSTAMLGTMNSSLAEEASSLGAMLQVQMQVQRENQVFTTVSNVLKTRHDTIKNTISNVH